MPDDLQFQTAEFTSATRAPCAVCQQPLTGPYFMTPPRPPPAGPALICAPCRDRIAAQLTRWPTPMEVALGAALGFGAAIAGSVAWWGFRAATGIEFGILAIGIAWLVAEAVLRGGGRGPIQQVLAVLLTYFAVASSYLPDFYTAMGAGESPIVRLVGAVFASIAMPYLLIQRGGSGLLWFVIVGIALMSAFRRTARLKLALQGPYQATSAP